MTDHHQIEKVYQNFIQGASICTDTRNITRGCIFFALRGERFNGNEFAQQALDSGAAWCVVDDSSLPENPQLIRVSNVLQFLQQLSVHHRRQLKVPVLAITGSNGKTTTKELIIRVLAKKYKVAGTAGNLNNHIGVPLTVLTINRDHEIAVIEMGANHQKEIELLCNLAMPTHVLITNVGKAHLEGFGGFEGVKKGKGEMYTYARENNAEVFINADNSHLTGMLGNHSTVIKYGSELHYDITGKLLDDSAHVHLSWKTKSDKEFHQLKTQITGKYNVENILSAIAIGVRFGVRPDEIKQAIESYFPSNQRSQEIQLGTNTIIMDAYNANPTSMEAALQNLVVGYSGKKGVLLGEMLELGEDSIPEHQKLAARVQDANLEFKLFVGTQFENIRLPDDAVYFSNSVQASEWIRKNPIENFTLLIKGSRGARMELLLEALKK
jgi:UDP-N-acetylmuramoyl-tripeptide--D-alanyl-D-alanine ligase